MSEESRKLVVLITQGLESELSSVAFTQVHPLEPLRDLMQDFLERGGTLWACTPCVKSRGYEQDDLIEGTVITGASVMHELIQGGAATLSF